MSAYGWLTHVGSWHGSLVTRTFRGPCLRPHPLRASVAHAREGIEAGAERPPCADLLAPCRFAFLCRYRAAGDGVPHRLDPTSAQDAGIADRRRAGGPFISRRHADNIAMGGASDAQHLAVEAAVFKRG